MKSLLENLNSEQKKAVEHTKGPVLILAGAGSGKTRVITHRIAYLVLNEKIAPQSICAVTFTNKAAAEMKERVIQLLPNTHKGIFIKTFHSLCLQILRWNYEFIGLNQNFTVYDSSLQESLIKEVIKSKNLDTKLFIPSQIANKINHSKDSMIPFEEFGLEYRQDQYTKNIKEIFQEYEIRKQKNNAVDFGDLIFKTVELFQKNPSILDKYNMYWKYIMIDEYQDTNKVQYILSKLLAGVEKNICVVGDDDQSIYSWRGADIRNILNFEKDFENTFTIKLEENYRSTANIIKAASSLIKNNLERKDKNIFSNKEDGALISLKEYQSENAEASLIIKQIQNLYKLEKSYLKFAIFYRTNAQSRYFEESLRAVNMPYKIFGGFRFFDRLEIKDIIAYLSVIVNPNDNLSLTRIINSPPRGIGETSLEKILNYSIDKRTTMLASLKETIPDIRKNTILKMKEFYFQFEKLIQMYKEKTSPSFLLKELLEKMGIIEYYKTEASIESTDRLENIEQFANALQEFEEQNPESDLAEYLNTITLLTSEENNSELQDYVTLMTVHNSKGLEFDYVFLAGMEEGTFPHVMSLDTEKEIEEERRLCYVAITRARKKLYMSYSSYTRKFGQIEPRNSSRFFKELPEELFETNSYEKEYHYPAVTPYAENRKEDKNLDNTKRSITEVKYKIGDKVRHKDFGVGKIIDITGNGDNLKAKIAFGFNSKNFLLAYTKLEKLGD